MTPDERATIIRLLAQGEDDGTWNIYLHPPKYRHMEMGMGAAIRAVYALVGVDVFQARLEEDDV